jgi:hypothetical protein
MPTSAAFLWCSPRAPSRRCLHHPIVSHCYTPTLPLGPPPAPASGDIDSISSDNNTGSSSGVKAEEDFVLPAECAMLGTRDYSAMLVAPAALAFAEVARLIASCMFCSTSVAVLLHPECLMFNIFTHHCACIMQCTMYYM